MALRLPTRVPIRARTAAALSIPLVMLLVVAGLEITQSGEQVADVREQSELATASIGPAGAINALMTERNYTSLWLFGVEASVDLHVESLDDARDKTDDSLAAFVREVRRRGGRAEQIYGPAIEAFDALGDNRARVDAYEGERNPTVENPSGDRVWSIYNRLVFALADANTDLAYEVEDQQLRQGVQLVDMASRQVDMVSKIVRTATIEAVRARGPITDRTDYGLVVRMMSEADRHHEAILDLATGPYAALREPLSEESEATGIFGVEREFGETGEVDIAGLLRGVSIDEDESYYGFIHEVSDVMRERSDDLEAAARANQSRIIVLSLLLLVVAVAASLVVARSITRPLRSLTHQAREMAQHRLPGAVREVHELPLGQDVVVPELEPVVVVSRDEVGDVADQLNAVQTAALDLAVEQAVMRRNFSDVFVSICRRIQGLLWRQLDLIAEVTAEPAPSDVGPATGRAGRRRERRPPDLTEISRYAIRLRRHAESLLVLAGVEPRPKSGKVAPIGEVVQATLDEVSGAERVQVLGVEPVMVAGRAVGDLAHLLAELMESALRELFPEETVNVAGAVTDDGYTLSIADPGSGMAEDEIERANRRLAGEEADTTAPSKYLGQYVAARLAARHGISVTLWGTMRAGVTAAVHLPPTLLAGLPPSSPPVPAEPLVLDAAEDGADPADALPAAPPPLPSLAELFAEASDRTEASADAPAPDPEPEPEPETDTTAPDADTDDADADAEVDVEVTEVHEDGDASASPNGQDGNGSDDDVDGDVDVDVYSALSDFPEGVDRPALAAPSPRRPVGESN